MIDLIRLKLLKPLRNTRKTQTIKEYNFSVIHFLMCLLYLLLSLIKVGNARPVERKIKERTEKICIQIKNI